MRQAWTKTTSTLAARTLATGQALRVPLISRKSAEKLLPDRTGPLVAATADGRQRVFGCGAPALSPRTCFPSVVPSRWLSAGPLQHEGGGRMVLVVAFAAAIAAHHGRLVSRVAGVLIATAVAMNA